LGHQQQHQWDVDVTFVGGLCFIGFISHLYVVAETESSSIYCLNSMVQHPVARVLQKFINLHRTQLQSFLFIYLKIK
jgi:hypothetical protein